MSDRVWQAIIACATEFTESMSMCEFTDSMSMCEFTESMSMCEFTESPKTAVSVQDCRTQKKHGISKKCTTCTSKP